jgi:competence protein ComEA
VLVVVALVGLAVSLPSGGAGAGVHGVGGVAVGGNGSGSGVGASAGYRLNINTATEAELRSLPGVGAVLAGRIVSMREELGGFGRVDELDDVRGIGAKTLEGLRGSVRVD